MEAALKKHRPNEDASAFASAIVHKLVYTLGKSREQAEQHDWALATIYALRDRIVDRWVESQRRHHGQKRVYYLSIEYLTGRLLCEAACNMRLEETLESALTSLGQKFNDLCALEPDPALGSGGLGRLAACYVDSMASLGIPAIGYGIRYAHGLFRQTIHDGWQREAPDDWLEFGDPWEFERRRITYPIRFAGAVEYPATDDDTPRGVWDPGEVINAVAYDTPVVGWRGRDVNTLRLWSARASEAVHLPTFHHGDHVGASALRTRIEAISGVLYPNADNNAGRELRLRQEYFFTSASLQDIVKRHVAEHGSVVSMPDYVAIQMNDTHSALAVAEMMRILVDEHNLSWQHAWTITTSIINYTNHTLLPEAFETWPVELMNWLLPRHMQIIFLINWQHLRKVSSRRNGAEPNLASLSLIAEDGERRVRMGHLSFIGSRKINGVSALHTDIMRRTSFHELDEFYPGRITNKTNGISLRRWLLQANPELTELIESVLGPDLPDDFDRLRKLDDIAHDQRFIAKLKQIRTRNKQRLCDLVYRREGIKLEPTAMFDVQIKRIHEYKRQLLNIVETLALYHSIRADPDAHWQPRIKIFAGKAAPNYTYAKLVIKLINDVARLINSDPVIGNKLKVVFMENYGVSLAEAIIPAADLSEQISTAGFEASGTGNMKLAVNGALTVGTLDGANVEIRDGVGADNIFIFGLTASEVAQRKAARFPGSSAVTASALLAETLHSISSGLVSRDDPARFRPIVERLTGYDEYMVAADFDSYWHEQRRIDRFWRDQKAWWRISLLNTARMGWFSADRAIREYAEDIWHVPVSTPQANK